jgi:mannosyltransferase OCH1-like enzyme
MIPKNIILTSKERPIQYLDLIKKFNQDFIIKFFDDKSARDLIALNFSANVLQAYDKVTPTAYKADIFRYCALYLLGGVYTDPYIPYGKSFDELWDLTEDRIFLVQDTSSNAIQISTMVSPKKSKFMQLCIEKAVFNILNNNYGESPFSITGPHMAWQCFSKYTGQSNSNYGIYPSVMEHEPAVQIDYRLIKTNEKVRKTITEAVYVDKQDQFVCAYKENKFRTHRNKSDYYYNAWMARTVYGEAI